MDTLQFGVSSILYFFGEPGALQPRQVYKGKFILGKRQRSGSRLVQTEMKRTDKCEVDRAHCKGGGGNRFSVGWTTGCREKVIPSPWQLKAKRKE